MTQEPLTTRQAERRPGLMPKLSFRSTSSAKSEDVDKGNAPIDSERPAETPDDQPKPSRLTIRQIRESMTAANSNNYSPPTPTWNSPPDSPLDFPPPSKKKGSFFSGLFSAKEPTQVALNQVAAQMMAQHGSTSATKVPNVSLEKMPAYVPKVNSKWDGIPEAIKQREKWEKERQRALGRQSNSPSSGNTDERFEGRNSRASFSTSNNDYRDLLASSASQMSSPVTQNPHKFYAISVNSSGDLVSQQRQHEMSPPPHRPCSSTRSSSHTPLSGIAGKSSANTSTALQGLAIDHGTPAQNRDQPTRNDDLCQENEEILAAEHSIDTSNSESDYRSSVSTNSSINDEADADQTENPANNSSLQKSVHPVPATSMGGASALSPIHETHHSNPGAETPSLGRQDVEARTTPTTRQIKHVKKSSVGFLAGEARPFELPTAQVEEPFITKTPVRQQPDAYRSPDLEKRPDTSRERLGLRASMLVESNVVPWETTDVPQQTSLQRSATTKSSWQPGQSGKRSKKFGIF